MKIFRVLTITLILFLSSFSGHASTGKDTENFLTTISKQHKDSYRSVLIEQCELVRKEWRKDDFAEGLNHIIYFLDLYKRAFATHPIIYGNCRTLSEGGVPSSLYNIDSNDQRYSGWIGVELSWLVKEETLSNFASFVYKNTYERRWRTPWNKYYKKFFKKISDPLTCKEVVNNYIFEIKDKEFPVDVRAHTYLHLRDNYETFLAEDSNDFEENYYPLTLLSKDESLVVGGRFEPKVFISWKTNEISYKDNPSILKFIDEYILELHPNEPKLVILDSNKRFKLDNYELTRSEPPLIQRSDFCN